MNPKVNVRRSRLVSLSDFIAANRVYILTDLAATLGYPPGALPDLSDDSLRVAVLTDPGLNRWATREINCLDA